MIKQRILLKGLEEKMATTTRQRQINRLFAIKNITKALCEKFVKKVESGRARSKETYAECKALLDVIEGFEKDQK